MEFRKLASGNTVFLTFSKSQRKTAAIIFMIMFYIAGRIGAAANYSGFIELIWISILFCGFIALLFHRPWQLNFLIKSFLIIVTGFMIEVAGVKSGLIFGEYQYGEILGAKIFGIPVVIGYSWLIITYIASCLLCFCRWPILINAVLVATAVTIFDMALEPFAIENKMWIWQQKKCTCTELYFLVYHFFYL